MLLNTTKESFVPHCPSGSWCVNNIEIIMEIIVICLIFSVFSLPSCLLWCIFYTAFALSLSCFHITLLKPEQHFVSELQTFYYVSRLNCCEKHFYVTSEVSGTCRADFQMFCPRERGRLGAVFVPWLSLGSAQQWGSSAASPCRAGPWAQGCLCALAPARWGGWLQTHLGVVEHGACCGCSVCSLTPGVTPVSHCAAGSGLVAWGKAFLQNFLSSWLFSDLHTFRIKCTLKTKDWRPKAAY